MDEDGNVGIGGKYTDGPISHPLRVSK
ncbi:hypothetical protein EE612_021997 [Oryza sativa]|nr:hypothetical protein EE612_021997 [Oryza sativa]